MNRWRRGEGHGRNARYRRRGSDASIVKKLS